MLPEIFSKAVGFLAPMESLSMHSGAVEPLVVQAQGQGDHQESNKELLTHVWAKPASPSSSLLKFPSPTVSPASLCAAFIPFLPAKSRQCSAWLLQCLHSLRSPARLLCCLCLPALHHMVWEHSRANGGDEEKDNISSPLFVEKEGNEALSPVLWARAGWEWEKSRRP